MQSFVVFLKPSRSVQINHLNCFQEIWCQNEFYISNLEYRFAIYLTNHCFSQDLSPTWHRKCCDVTWLSLLPILVKRSNYNVPNSLPHWHSQLNSHGNWKLALNHSCRENTKKSLVLIRFWDLEVEGEKKQRYARVSKNDSLHSFLFFFWGSTGEQWKYLSPSNYHLSKGFPRN